MPNRYVGVNTNGQIVALPQALLEVYSADILHEAMGIMKFENFLVKKNDLMKSPGQTIMMNRYNNLQRGGQLDENTALIEKAMSGSQLGVTVTEYGNAVGVTEKALVMSPDDILAQSAILLGRDYAVVNDIMCRDALTMGSQELFVEERANIAALQGAVDYFDTEIIRKGVEILQTKNAPKFLGQFYICFIHPHQASYLKRDPDWVAANNYANTRALFTGEVGRWEDVLFIATTNCRNGAAPATDPGYTAAFDGTALGGAGAADAYEALLFSDSAAGKATALPAELRDSGPIDYGRKHGLAWYSIMGSAILEDDFIVKLYSV